MKEESEKTGLKLKIQKSKIMKKNTQKKPKIMASDLITFWQIDGGKWTQCQISFSWAPK